nr:pentatricopeptide repeat-containing protein At1g63330-like [Coffea arabica]
MCVKGIPVNEYTLNVVINCYCLVGRVDLGFSILGGFFKRGLVPDVAALALYLRDFFESISLCKDKMVDEALALFREMIEKSLPADVVSYNCLIQVVDALCKEGQAEDAEEVVSIMIQQGQTPNLVTYNSLMDGYCLHCRIDEAGRIFNTMVTSGLTPDLHSYAILINAYFKNKEVEEAMNLFRELQHKGLTPNIVVYTLSCRGYLVQEGISVQEKFLMRCKLLA